MKIFKLKVNDRCFIVKAKSEESAVKKLKDSKMLDAKDYVINITVDGNKNKMYYKANNVMEALKQLANESAGKGYGTANVYVISAHPDDGYDIYGKLSDILKKFSIKDESVEEKERKAQEWVDYDIEHYGKVSEKTKSDIKKMGLDFDKWDNQVRDAKVVWKKCYTIGFSDDGIEYDLDGKSYDSESKAQSMARLLAKGSKYYQVNYCNEEYYQDPSFGEEATGNFRIIWSKVYETATGRRIK